VFPNADQTISVEQVRSDVRARLGYIRILRNRIAHHEPIFDRPIADHLARMRTLVEHRSTTILTWLGAWVSNTLAGGVRLMGGWLGS
jgi:hypothetical protein